MDDNNKIFKTKIDFIGNIYQADTWILNYLVLGEKPPNISPPVKSPRSKTKANLT